MIVIHADWHLQAPCAGQWDLFYSVEPVDQAAAKRICATCGFATQCLAEALIRGEPDGIWGGLNPDDRNRLIGKWSKRAATREQKKKSSAAANCVKQAS